MIPTLKKISLLTIVLQFICTVSKAQVNIETYYDSVATVETTPAVIPSPVYEQAKFIPVITFNNLLVRDYMLGFGGGVQYTKLRIQTCLNFDFRPYFKNVTFKENDTLNYQYKEKDYYFNLSIEKQFNLMKTYPSIRPYILINTGILWGNFKGWNKSPEQKIAFAFGAGAFLAINKIVGIKLGYQYFKPLVLQTTPHRVCLQIQFNMYE